MFIVVNELFVQPENRQVFEANFGASMGGTLPGVPGLQAARLLAPQQPDRGYLSMLEFTDEAAFSAYHHSDAFQAAHNWPNHAPIDSNRLSTYEVRVEVPRSG